MLSEDRAQFKRVVSIADCGGVEITLQELEDAIEAGGLRDIVRGLFKDSGGRTGGGNEFVFDERVTEIRRILNYS